ncbi:MAG: imidazole glycerol phosphate synthase subunit HisH [Eubacteriales bacterium]|nr:imidazole glycerol phosphate synthase subunit HisH [Eubacteriales bacterium]
MIAIVDYGVGNIFSLYSSFGMIGQEVELTGDAEKIRNADRVILPGVGAFADAAEKLKATGLDQAVKDAAKAGKPLMGICLGMQLLFDKSLEFGEHEGLGLVKGSVVPLRGYVPDNYKIPHIGWNYLKFPEGKEKSPIFKYIDEGSFVYFVHSYYASECDESTIASTEYGQPVTAAVQNENVFGLQFHPEKSGEVGMNILRAFCEI